MRADTSKVHRRAARGAVLAVALLAAGCSGDDDGARGGGEGAPSATTVAATPGASGRCADDDVRVGPDGDAIAGLVEQAVADEDLTSVIYRVERDGELIAAGAVGDNVTGVPATQDLHFRNGNVAFAYMGTLLLVMAEDGELALDDPVSRWLPDLDVPNADTVTLEMLVASTSGYPDYVPDETFQDTFLDDPFGSMSVDDLLGYAFATPPWYEPGTSWNYAHTNYVILGEALAAAGGKPLHELLTERVIEPMGLEGTTPVLTPEVPEPVLHTFSTERDVFEETTFWNPSWQTAPGSVVATNICDLVTSASAIGTGELLTDESFEQMVAGDTAELGPPPASCPSEVCRQFPEGTHYGLGVIVRNGWIHQTPLFGGAGGVHAYLPSEDLAVAMVAVTGQGSEVGVNHAQRIWQSIAGELTPDAVPA
jgi:CubicO group peptidase (beta-lactamase class C family)